MGEVGSGASWQEALLYTCTDWERAEQYLCTHRNTRALETARNKVSYRNLQKMGGEFLIVPDYGTEVRSVTTSPWARCSRQYPGYIFHEIQFHRPASLTSWGNLYLLHHQGYPSSWHLAVFHKQQIRQYY